MYKWKAREFWSILGIFDKEQLHIKLQSCNVSRGTSNDPKRKLAIAAPSPAWIMFCQAMAQEWEITPGPSPALNNLKWQHIFFWLLYSSRQKQRKNEWMIFSFGWLDITTKHQSRIIWRLFIWHMGSCFPTSYPYTTKELK